tara:strand:- start:2641 stop:2976 length:336 start_codon:yes stop_codon:yes gene_type:complete
MAEETSDEVIYNVLYAVLAIFVGMMLGIMLLYSYSISNDAFVSVLAFIYLTYAMISMGYTLIKQKMYNDDEFNINLGADMYAAFLSFVILLYFGYKTMVNDNRVSVQDKYY